MTSSKLAGSVTLMALTLFTTWNVRVEPTAGSSESARRRPREPRGSDGIKRRSSSRSRPSRPTGVSASADGPSARTSAAELPATVSGNTLATGFRDWTTSVYRSLPVENGRLNAPSPVVSVRKWSSPGSATDSVVGVGPAWSGSAPL